MSVIKCKMCGGELNLVDGASIAECEYCGSKQTIPNLDNEKKLLQFERAERLRKQCEFDKAAGIYELIVADFHQESEAYWGLVLCKFGIEYVDDPATGKKIPTCHRSSYDSILEDTDFEQAVENADPLAQRVYREEAKQFERIRKGILEVSANEQAYDIFICYKETDENGDRTLDSVLAQDLYTALTDKGYRVFFSRISLQEKLGEAYEPYIFAALNSAKVMLAIGSCYEYYNAVWVKNEWSRFLMLCAKDNTKHLIPCYKNLDPEDMPKAFNHLQGADLGKMGAIQDILFNMEKYIPQGKEPTAARTANSVTGPLLQNALAFLEKKDWKRADAACEQALIQDMASGEAYLYKLLAEKKVKKPELLKECKKPISKSDNYQKAMLFGDAKVQHLLLDATATIIKRRKKKRIRKAIVFLILAASAALAYITPTRIIPAIKYNKAMALTEKFYNQGLSVEDRDELFRITQQLYALDYPESKKKATMLASTLSPNSTLSAGYMHSVAVKSDGTVVAVGNASSGQCGVSDWTDIISVSAGSTHTVGLKADGTVIATSNSFFNTYVNSWTNIISVAAGNNFTLALRANGTVQSTGKLSEESLYTWDRIYSIAAGGYHAVGLKIDGRVVADGSNSHGQCDVSGWTDIMAVSAGTYHTVALKRDGTVVAVGNNDDGQCDVSGWTDIIAISAGASHTLGLKRDGTVVAVGNNSDGQCGVSGWTDIIAITAGQYHSLAMTKDGTIVTVGSNKRGQRNITDWGNLLLPGKQ